MKKIIFTLSLALFALIIHAQWQWQNPLPQGHDLKAVCFINQNMDWAVGDFGTIVYTTDGGITWEEQISSTTYLLEDICFTDQNNGWVVGGCGTIRHTINGGIADGEEFIIQNPKFNIQCYPNPFLKKTAIKYTLDKQSLVLLEIFDIKGQKITSLVNEKQYAGKYQIEFDASELPAGIYFYSLKTSQGKQTGKMVLMR